MGTQGIAIGGMAEEDIANMIAANWKQKEGEKWIGQAGNELTQANTKAQTYYQPYAETGGAEYQQLAQNVENGQYNPGQFSFNAQDLQNEPGYQFQLQQGMKNTQAANAARGLGISGGTLKALSNYNQGLAGTSYQQAFNRAYQTYGANAENLRNQFNMGNTIAGYGYNANNSLAGLATQYGADMAGMKLAMGSNNVQAIENLRQTFNEQGQHLQDIGSGNLGSQSGGQGQQGGLGSSGSSGGETQMGNDFGGETASAGGEASA